MDKVSIYVFVSGMATMTDGSTMFTAASVTEQGKGIAGSMHKIPGDALSACMGLTKRKAPTMLSSPFTAVYKQLTDSEVQTALSKYFERLPIGDEREIT
jgi:hypothetical protein